MDLHEARLREQLLVFFHGAKRIHRGGKRREGLLVAGPMAEEHAAAGLQNAADLTKIHQRLVPEADGLDGEGGSEASVGVRNLRARRERDFRAARFNPASHAPASETNHRVGGIDPSQVGTGGLVPAMPTASVRALALDLGITRLYS